MLEGRPPAADAVVASWRGPVGAELAARLGHDVVLCPDLWTYLDYRQSDDPREPIPVGTVLSLEDVAAFDPVPDDAPATLRDRVIGVQANVWTEHLDTRERLDYAVFPRLGAFAEVAWNGGPLDWDDFASRLPAYLAWLEAEGVDFRPLDGPRPDQQRPGVPGVAAEPRRPDRRARPPHRRPPRDRGQRARHRGGAAHPRARSRHPYGSKRYPSPGSLRKCRGSDGTSSSLRRSCATYRRR